MNIPILIARRYLFSKKSHNVINVISIISMVGIAVCSTALIIILSAFNGIEDLVGSLYSTFDSDLRVTVVEGKTFNRDSFPFDELRANPPFAVWSEVIEESVGLKNEDEQSIATIKGVQESFVQMSGLDSMMREGDLFLSSDGYPFAVVGLGLRYDLNIQATVLEPTMLNVYAIRRNKDLRRDREKALNGQKIEVSGVFSVNAALDTRYMVVPISFARELLEYENEITAVEIDLAEGYDPEVIKPLLQEIVGPKYDVKTRYEQNEIIYETTRNEKWITFIILSFILLIATFNVVGSLTMLVLEKKKDIATLVSMGANRSTVRNIFFFEGMLINLVGGVSGVILGFLLCGVQQLFGLIPLQGSVTNTYPILMIWTDFAAVLGIVIMLGVLISWVPVYYLTRKHFADRTGPEMTT